MKSRWCRMVGQVGVAALLALVVSGVGCKKGSSNPDGGDGSIGDLKPNTDTPSGDRADVGGAETPGLQHDRHAEGRGRRVRVRRPVRQSLLRRRRLLRPGVQGRLQDLQRPRHRRQVRDAQGGRRPARFVHLHEDAGVHLQLRRQVRRRRRMPQVSGEHAVQVRHVRRRRGRRLVRLRRQRSLQAGFDAHLRAVHVQPGHRRLLRLVHVQQPVRQRPGLRAGKLRQADDRRQL